MSMALFPVMIASVGALFWTVQILFYSTSTHFAFVSARDNVPDLYTLLGVSRSATIQQIKQAYRRKALDTHPDKNQHLDPEIANETFRQVVHAFEILSDTSSRQYYDRTGRIPGQNNNNNNDNNSGRYRNNYHQHQSGGGNHHFHFQWSGRARVVRMKDRFEVRQAQDRVLHVISLSQLYTIMFDENDVLERNLLICITTPKTSHHADDEMVYPYPFAAMSSQNIWWEDLLQTVRIQVYRTNEITKLFNISMYDIDEKPVFIFGKRGTTLNEETGPNLSRIYTRSRETYESWVWEQIQVKVQFINQHQHPIELYWIHGTKAKLQEIVEPNDISYHTTMLSHEWYVRDVRVDTFDGSHRHGRHKLTLDSSLGSYKILNDTNPQIIIIKANQCFDLSGHCSFWQAHENACTTNPNFMKEHCKKTCDLCSSETQSTDDTYKYNNDNDNHEEKEEDEEENVAEEDAEDEDDADNNDYHDNHDEL